MNEDFDFMKTEALQDRLEEVNKLLEKFKSGMGWQPLELMREKLLIERYLETKHISNKVILQNAKEIINIKNVERLD